jgi:hypothetical protein
LSSSNERLEEQRVEGDLLRRRISGGDAARAVTTAALLTVLAAQPAPAASQYAILGAGGRPCGSWLQARSQASPESTVLQSWVLGYITSINANLLTVSQDVADGNSPEGLFTWIDGYCSAHPLDSVARAAGNLYESLRAKSGAR